MELAGETGGRGESPLDLALGDVLLEPLPRLLPRDVLPAFPDEILLLVLLLDLGLLLESFSSILLNMSLDVVWDGDEIRGGIPVIVESVDKRYYSR